MPTYEYKCKECTHVFEVQQRMIDAPIKTCPKCSGEVNKIFSAAGIVLKGSGFHNTDYNKQRRKEPVKCDACAGNSCPAKKA